jgi:hypothetical protein
MTRVAINPYVLQSDSFDFPLNLPYPVGTFMMDVTGRMWATNGNIWAPAGSLWYITPELSGYSTYDHFTAVSEKMALSVSWTKLREVRVPFTGYYTIDLNLKAAQYGTGGTAYARIYINGVAVGTQRSTTSTSYQDYTETVAIATGDKIQLYVSGSGTGYNYAYAVNDTFTLRAREPIPLEMVGDSLLEMEQRRVNESI